MIKLARKYTTQASFKVANLIELQEHNTFDGIRCCRVFHHIPLHLQDKFLEKIASLIKKDGVFYLTAVVSDIDKDYEAYDSGNERLLKKRLSKKSFESLVTKHNFEILQHNYRPGKQ